MKLSDRFVNECVRILSKYVRYVPINKGYRTHIETEVRFEGDHVILKDNEGIENIVHKEIFLAQMEGAGVTNNRNRDSKCEYSPIFVFVPYSKNKSK